MFLLEGMLGQMLLACLVSAITACLLFLLAYAILRSKSRLFGRRKKASTKGSAKSEPLAPTSEEELPEDVLIAILTAAVHACEETEKKRFRVVSFRRTR